MFSLTGWGLKHREGRVRTQSVDRLNCEGPHVILMSFELFPEGSKEPPKNFKQVLLDFV